MSTTRRFLSVKQARCKNFFQFETVPTSWSAKVEYTKILCGSTVGRREIKYAVISRTTPEIVSDSLGQIPGIFEEVSSGSENLVWWCDSCAREFNQNKIF